MSWILSSAPAFASSYFKVTSTTSSTNVENDADANFNSEPEGTKAKSWSYGMDMTVSESYTPTNFLSVKIPTTNFNTHAFATTLYTNEYDLAFDVYSPGKWNFEVGYQYARQMAAGTPNTFTYIPWLQIGQDYEYGRKRKAADGEDLDPFRPSWGWKFKVSDGALSADQYAIERADTQTYLLPGTTIDELGVQGELSWTPAEWISFDGTYEGFTYNSDPNFFAVLRSPKIGTPTSLNLYESTGDITFYMGDSWNLDVKVLDAMAATSDKTESDEWTIVLTYASTSWELGLGYDHLQTNSGSADVDSSVIEFRLDFD